jgi:hypothetical protein
MAEDRLARVCSDIHATCAEIHADLEQIKRQMRHATWLLLYILTWLVIIFTKLFFP